MSNFEPNLSQRVRHKNVLVCFCIKIKFCCKMHMQKFCTEVTILPLIELCSPDFLGLKKLRKRFEVCRNYLSFYSKKFV